MHKLVRQPVARFAGRNRSPDLFGSPSQPRSHTEMFRHPKSHWHLGWPGMLDVPRSESVRLGSLGKLLSPGSEPAPPRCPEKSVIPESTPASVVTYIAGPVSNWSKSTQRMPSTPVEREVRKPTHPSADSPNVMSPVANETPADNVVDTNSLKPKKPVNHRPHLVGTFAAREL